MIADPVADMLTRIRNALMRFADEVELPSSRMKVEIARILTDEGYIESYSVEEGKPCSTLKLRLKYRREGTRSRRPAIQGLRRVSTSARRVYVGADAIPRTRGGLGTAVLSTSQGIMTGREARRRDIGGEVLYEVW
ncbi:TPA: 30S ribosomal protein S8 [Candidatus Acetothermia bacterium]|nr:30S ribosomal protein S8 [Candidatus Acetothermia bacterium]HAZ30667.1 30S ribosomal protein S8 [Candidatus Acetothermia bacterium]